MSRCPAFLAGLLCAAALGLTVPAAPAFPAPPVERAAALAGLHDPDPAKRADAIAWIASHGSMADAELLHERLRDANPVVRAYAETGLWALWSRSGDPQVDALMVRGVDEMNGGRLAEAVASFSEAIRVRPQFAEAWNKRATAYFLMHEYRKSIADCAEVLARNPKHFGALSGLGQIYLALDDPEQALKWFRRALEVNPNMPTVEYNVKALEEALKKRRGRMI
jgi:tetratricopeptide (TPR) repeat protein